MATISTTDVRAAQSDSRRARWATLLQRQGALIALVLLVLWGALRYPNFLSTFNITEVVLRSNATFGLIALGMTFVIMTGGIDLSVGSVAALASVVAALASGRGLAVALAAAVAVGTLAGLFNGLVITRLRIAPFIATLAMLLGARGLALVLANNQAVAVNSSGGFATFGFQKIAGLPLLVMIMLAAYVLGSMMLNFTRWGRHVLAIGGNEEAARLLGLPVDRIKLQVYALSGALAGLAGLLLATITFTGIPTEGVGWELTAIAAVVVGGTLLTGGVGSVGTTLVGVLLLGLILNILNLENARGVISLSAYWQSVIRGAFLLVVVVLQTRLVRRQR
jgi:ribose transport system permease protein